MGRHFHEVHGFVHGSPGVREHPMLHDMDTKFSAFRCPILQNGRQVTEYEPSRGRPPRRKPAPRYPCSPVRLLCRLKRPRRPRRSAGPRLRGGGLAASSLTLVHARYITAHNELCLPQAPVARQCPPPRRGPDQYPHDSTPTRVLCRTSPTNCTNNIQIVSPRPCTSGLLQFAVT